jgi:hypothetical protein
MPVRTTLIAREIADPVKGRPRGRGRVLGGGASASYIDFDGWVVAVTGAGVAAMPNGITLAGPVAPEWPKGEGVDLDARSLAGRRASVDLSKAVRWSPVAPCNVGRSPEEVRRRCEAILDTCGASRPPIPGASQLLGSLKERDQVAFGAAVDELIGRGGGLTPEGDDLLAATAAALFSFGTAAGLSTPTRSRFLRAMCPGDLRRRTTSLSATLLELAAGGNVVGPLRTLIDLDQPQEQWQPALNRLIVVGHSTGRTWVLGCAHAGAAIAGASAA